MKYAEQINTLLEVSRTWERIPLWMYWLGILNALEKHTDDLLRLSPIETARLARSWLRHTPLGCPGRQQAVTLAMAVARQAIRKRQYYPSASDGQLPYKALLEAYPDKPDEVREILLQASARVIPTEDDGEAFNNYEAPGTITHVKDKISGGDRTAQPPWPDGPLYRADDDFRSACIETDALRGVMSHSPGLANEIILALLIEHRPPKSKYGYPHGNMLNEEGVCLTDDQRFYPRFYTKGPFLLFLRTKPEAALQTIIRLIDFATERWMEHHYPEENRKKGLDLMLDGAMKTFTGDEQVYHWYHGYSRSNIASSALMAVEKWLYDCIDQKESIEGWIDLIFKMSHSMAFLGLLSEIGRHTPELFGDTLRPLILTPATYELETSFTSQGGHNFGTPFPLFEGEWFFKMAREWDSMGHRQHHMIDISADLFHHNAETREALLLARQQWSELPDGSNEFKKRQRLELIATFDEKNWKKVEGPDGRKLIVIEKPEYLRASNDQVVQSEKELLLMTLPKRCRLMLDEGKPFEAEQIPDLLDWCKQLHGFKCNNEETARIAPAENAVLGVIAVLFVLNRDWLQDNPLEEKWCIGMLDQTLENPPLPSEFDMPESSSNYTWEHFACDIATVIWAENPGYPKSMERIAYLAMAKHYNSVCILLSRAFERREELGKRFWMLVNLLLDWAAIRYEIIDSYHSGKNIDVSKYLSKAANKFIKGKYPTDIPPWGQLCIEKTDRWTDHDRLSCYRGEGEAPLFSRVPRLDLRQIQAMFNLIFLPDQAISDEERTRFLIFWDQASMLCLSGTAFFDSNGHKLNPELIETGFPDEFEKWVLERLAVVVGQMRPDEKTERYWKPILSLGKRAEHWVKHFLWHWFTTVKKTIDPSIFIREWKKMLEFCLTSDIWIEQERLFAYHQSSLWLCMLGLQHFVTSFWYSADSPIIKEMESYFKTVADQVLPSADNAVKYLSWLSETPAKVIRRQMLIPIAKAGLEASDHWWKEEYLAKDMARYLRLLWMEHGQAIENDPNEKRLFHDLIHRAAQTHEALAMELQSTIGSRS